MHAQDHFSSLSRHYASFRPRYPQSLLEWLANIAPAHDTVWDCACGTGQASVDLAAHFSHVIATDLSSEQLTQAERHARVDYRQAVAENSALPGASVDLVTVAQALHWFDLEKFYAEARRVLRPGGVLAAWSYGILRVDAKPVDALLQSFYHGVVGPYWPAERKWVERGYGALPFPQPEITPPAIAMELQWNLETLLGYVSSWSATGRYIQSQGIDPLPELRAALTPLWGQPATLHTMRWPLSIRAAVP